MGERVFAKWGPGQRILAAMMLAAALMPMRLRAGEGGDDSSLLGFLSARGSERFDAERPSGRPAHGEAIADVLYTHSHGKLRLLAEGSVSTDDAEIDRLQVGWEPTPETSVWVGKFHQPASSWNFGHDHGHYLQTAISTPAIEKWADDAGALPENITGVLFDSRRPIGSSGVQLSLAAGIAPNPFHKDDSSYWVRPISRGSHPIGWGARLALLPDYVGSNNVGLLAAKQKLDVEKFSAAGFLNGARRVDETVYGAYAGGDWYQWSLNTAVYNVDLSLRETGSTRNESFVAGYAQLERRFADRYTAFVRHEDSGRTQESSYLHAVQDHFAVHRSLIGARWDFARHQALTLETSRATTLSNRSTSGINPDVGRAIGYASIGVGILILFLLVADGKYLIAACLAAAAIAAAAGIDEARDRTARGDVDKVQGRAADDILERGERKRAGRGASRVSPKWRR